MRGALTKVPGVQSADVAAGRTDVTVRYDPAQTDVTALLASLQAAGEGAKAR